MNSAKKGALAQATVVNVLSAKGGVGKSTIAMVLAHTLAGSRGRHAFLLDLDFSGTSWVKGLPGALQEDSGAPSLSMYLAQAWEGKTPDDRTVAGLFRPWRGVDRLRAVPNQVSADADNRMSHLLHDESRYGRVAEAIVHLVDVTARATPRGKAVFVLDHGPGMGRYELGTQLFAAWAAAGGGPAPWPLPVRVLSLFVCGDDRQDILQTYDNIATLSSALSREAKDPATERGRILGSIAVVFNRLRDPNHDPWTEYLALESGRTADPVERAAWEAVSSGIGHQLRIEDTADLRPFYYRNPTQAADWRPPATRPGIPWTKLADFVLGETDGPVVDEVGAPVSGAGQGRR